MGIGPLKGVSAHRRAHFSNALEPLYDLGGRWSGFRRQIVEYEGYGVSLLEGRGRGGPDLILLHGLGDRGSTWALMLRKLAQGPWGHILVPDLPGFGYAKASKQDQNTWAKLILSYLEKRIPYKVIEVPFEKIINQIKKYF